MTLKLIPVERSPQTSKDKKNFNPGVFLNKKKNKNGQLKNMCFKLIHFINRGGKFTYQQIDELIINMHHGILNLQQKKQEILKNKNIKSQRRKR